MGLKAPRAASPAAAVGATRPAPATLRSATARGGTRRRQRRHRARDAGRRRREEQPERGKTKLRRGEELRRETPQPVTPAACPSPASDRRREPKGVGACIGRRKTRGRHAAELPACRWPASAAARRGMAQECRRRAARWVSRPSPSLKPDHTSLADTCQRPHNSCTTRLSKHWIPVLFDSIRYVGRTVSGAS